METWNEIKHFTPEEFSCRCGCGFNAVDKNLVYVLDKMRSDLGQPIKITSGCRCPSYNKKVGGIEDSSHLPPVCQAADLYSPSSATMYSLVSLAIKYGIQRIGTAYLLDFIHVDVDDTKPKNLLWSY